MSIRDALYYELANDSGVAALADVYPAGRVPASVNARSASYLTYQTDSRGHHRHQTGYSLAEARFELQCHAPTARACRDLYTAVKDVLEQFRGDMGEAGSTVTVRGAFIEGHNEEFDEPPSDASQRGPRRLSMHYVIWHVQ